jgi:hypothetical protein
MKWILNLLLLISISSSVGCNNSRGTPDDLSWVQPIEFSKETKEWLGSLEWPQSAYADFDKIRRHNEKIRRIKGVATSP